MKFFVQDVTRRSNTELLFLQTGGIYFWSVNEANNGSNLELLKDYSIAAP